MNHAGATQKAARPPDSAGPWRVRVARAVVYLCGLILDVTHAGVAWPQQLAQGSGMGDGTSSPVLEEVVVTAEKREAGIQSVPISIAAISGDDLRAQGLASFSAVAQELPGISVRTSGPGQTEFEMRGMTSTGGESPTVGFYLDETPITPPATAQNGKVAIDPNLFDLSRVEVLRGPQGTLYGAGSMGGTIKLVTNPPDPKGINANAEAVASDTRGGNWNLGVNAMLNLPLLQEVAALRIVGTSQYSSGWIDRVVLNPFPLETGQSTACSGNGFYGCTRGNVLAAPVQSIFHGVNEQHLSGVRASVLVQPNDRWSIAASGFYQDLKMGGPNTYDNPPGRGADDTLAHYQPFDVAEPFEDRFEVSSLTAKYHFDAVDVTSATSYWNRTQTQTQDDSEVLQDAFGLNAFETSSGGLGTGSLTETDTSAQFSEEVRLSSTASHPFQWVVGGFYSHYRSTTSSYSYVPGLLTVFGGGVFNTDDFITVYRPSVVNQSAAFGEASYDLAQRWRVTAGLRYYAYNSDIVSTETGIVSPSGGLAPTTTYGRASASGTNPKLTLTHQLSSDLLLYATAAKGFRPGAGNMPVPVSGPASCASSLEALGKTQVPLQYNPDTVWSYELGEKTELLDHHLRINSAAYLERWSNVQQHVVLGCGFNYTDNAGDARIYGSELEIAAQITPELRLIQNGGYTHAALSRVTPETGGTVGQKLQEVPTWTASSAVVYQRNIAARRELVTRLQYSYVGSMEDVTYARNQVPGYGLASIRIGLDADASTVYVFVNNLTNTHAVLGNTISYSQNLPTFNRVATNQPRTIGLDLNFRF